MRRRAIAEILNFVHYPMPPRGSDQGDGETPHQDRSGIGQEKKRPGKRMFDRARLVQSAWPIFMAAIETPDPVQRSELLDALFVGRDASAECEWCWNVAQEVTKRQQQQPWAWVDLAEFMQPPPSSSQP